MWVAKCLLPDQFLTIGSLNVRGQLALSEARILNLVDFIKQYKIDILNLQETNLNDDSFEKNDFLSQNYQFIYNNAPNGFGTAVILKNDINFSNMKIDTKGKMICYDLDDQQITGANIYMQCGVTQEQ